MEKLELITNVNADILQVWDFFIRHENIRHLSPPEVEIQIIDPVPPILLTKHLIVEYRVKNPIGVFTQWKAKITDLEEPYFLADEQLEGMFAFWRQEYSFRPLTNEDGTEIINTIYYEPPWGTLGKVINVVFTQNALIELLEYRSVRMKDLLNVYVDAED